VDYRFKTVPYKHQLETLDKSKDEYAHALFMEMGTGKTKILLDNAAYLFDKGEIKGLLVVANKGSYLNWIDKEIPEHLPNHITVVSAPWITPSNKAIEEKLSHLFRPEIALKVLVVNVEALAFEKATKLCTQYLISYPSMMVVDESSVIKSPTAKRTKSCLQLGRFAKYRRIATGTPITRDPMDLYTQCQFLRTGAWGFSSFYAFRARYAKMIQIDAGGRRFNKVTGFQNLDELTNKLKVFSTLIKKTDCLDLPEKVYETRTVELTPDQKKLYEQMKNESIAELESGDVMSAPEIITKILRLHQIACGIATDENGQSHSIESDRVGALFSILEESEDKVVIWATYRRNIIDIAEKLACVYGEEYVSTYFGDTSVEDRRSAIDRMQNGDLKYLVCNPQTAGYGITLTKPHTSVYFSNNYDLGIRLQSEDRLHRIGQTNNVTYIDIVCKGTIDEKIVKVLKAKKNIADMVLNGGWKDLL
jgi:SNF2 family DNA or RNA helicase